MIHCNWGQRHETHGRTAAWIDIDRWIDAWMLDGWRDEWMLAWTDCRQKLMRAGMWRCDSADTHAANSRSKTNIYVTLFGLCFSFDIPLWSCLAAGKAINWKMQQQCQHSRSLSHFLPHSLFRSRCLYPSSGCKWSAIRCSEDDATHQQKKKKKNKCRWHMFSTTVNGNCCQSIVLRRCVKSQAAEPEKRRKTVHETERYHKSGIWIWNKCTLACRFDIWSLKLETIANEYRRSHHALSLTHPPCLSLSLTRTQSASLFGLSACLPAWRTWRTCRQHVPHLSIPVCVLSVCMHTYIHVCLYVCIPVTNTCINLITTNGAGAAEAATEWPSRTPNKWDITNLYWMPLMT